jgi:hypothetical protein
MESLLYSLNKLHEQPTDDKEYDHNAEIYDVHNITSSADENIRLVGVKLLLKRGEKVLRFYKDFSEKSTVNSGVSAFPADAYKNLHLLRG